MVGSGAISGQSVLSSLSSFLNSNAIIATILKHFELLRWKITLKLQSGIMLQKCEQWERGYAGELLKGPVCMAPVQHLQAPCHLPGGASQAAINPEKGLAALASHPTLPLSLRTHCPWKLPGVCAFRDFELGNQIRTSHAWFHQSNRSCQVSAFSLGYSLA